MTRLQLEHVIRAAAAIANDPDIVLIGSQPVSVGFSTRSLTRNSVAIFRAWGRVGLNLYTIEEIEFVCIVIVGQRMKLLLAILFAITAYAAFAQQKPLRERLLESAQKGDAEAQFELGKNYETGRIGLPKDFAQAEHWYRESAVQGDPYAEASLGLLYQFGKGLEQDSVHALMWFEVALMHSKDGDRDSIAELRDDVVRNMTKAQIAEARRLARDWKPKAAAR
jgi:hypothetical protein